MWKLALLVMAFAGTGFAGELETARIYFPFSDKPVGRWTGGALVGWDMPAPIIYAFGKDGRQAASIMLWEPAASELRLYGITRAPDGSYAAAGTAYISTGGAAFIWRISADGLRQQAFATGAYIANEIAVAPDGKLWTAGVQKQTPRLYAEDYAASHDIIHRFTPDGKPAGSWIPWKSVHTRTRLHPGSNSFLMAGEDRIVWYPVEADELIEFALDGQVRGRYPTVPTGSKQAAKGVALCGDGHLFAGRETYSASGTSATWEVLALDRASGLWRAVETPPGNAWGWLYGCEGGKLVTSRRNRPENALYLDFWTPLGR